MIFIAGLILIVLIVGVWGGFLRPLPHGIPFDGGPRPASSVRFLADTTYIDLNAEQPESSIRPERPERPIRKVRQEIFDEVFRIVSRAERFILMDMFLFNDFQGPVPELTRELSGELTRVLVKQKRCHPAMRIVFITDPINTVYGGMQSRHLEELEAAGVEVVVTRLGRLRDSNPLYSALWRTFFAVLGNTSHGGSYRNPFGEGRVSLRSWLRLLNFKANHRKVLVADAPGEPGGWVGLVTSANPHDASSAHGNAAVVFTGAAVADLLESERAVLGFSRGLPDGLPEVDTDSEGAGVLVSVVTERAIKDALLTGIRRAGRGDSLRMSTFYLSDREVIRELKEAGRRGADMRVILDPNFDAFGHKKNGIPNRQVGMELHKRGVPVRWCETSGEQCHAKVLLADYGDGRSMLVAGSANFTRRNLENFNLETDVVVEGFSDAEVFGQVRGWFDLLWGNREGEVYTVEFEKFAEDSIVKVLMYRAMEATGMSTF